MPFRLPINCICIAACCVLAACASGSRFDPITQDPPHVDLEFPTTSKSVALSSGSETINAMHYIAQGRGPHPVVLIARGYPDYLGNLDIAMALRRAGFNVFAFNYRGCWGSNGTVSLTHSVEDIEAAVQYLRSEEAQANERVNPAQNALLGYSLGGPSILKAAAGDAALRKLILVDSTDVREMFADVDTSTGARRLNEELESSAIRVSSTTAIVDDYIAHRNDWDPPMLATRLDEKEMLWIYASKGNGQFEAKPAWPKLVESSRGLSVVMIETDHGFSDSRILLTRRILSWLLERESHTN